MKQLLFVDDEPKVLQGLQRQLHCMRDEWHMDFFDSAAKALNFMATTSTDVIVTDMTMPGMDGAQLLTEVQNHYPNTVRLVLSGQGDRESAFKLVGPAHQYLSKPCDAGEFRNTISRALALRNLFFNEQLQRLVTRIRSLPTLPTLHVRLTDELRKADPSIERVCEIVSKDPSMTAKIMQLVNSAFFGLPQSMNRIDDAILYLGLSTVRDLVLSLQVFYQFNQTIIKSFSIETLTQHCWVTATLARKIAVAEHRDAKFGDECFLSGLLHDVGQLILASNLPEQYTQSRELAHKDNLPIIEAERVEFGATHAEVGGYLLALWGLPASVVEAVAFHHRPADCMQRGLSPVLVVHVANAFAHDLADTHSDWPGNYIDMACLTDLVLEHSLEAWRICCLSETI